MTQYLHKHPSTEGAGKLAQQVRAPAVVAQVPLPKLNEQPNLAADAVRPAAKQPSVFESLVLAEVVG